MSDVILIGGLSSQHRARVREFCIQSNAPVYAEPLSGLREDEALRHLLVQNERMLARGGFDCVIRIGHVPTLRFWRDLDESLRHIRVVSYSDLPFAGLSRGEVRSIGDLRPATGDLPGAFIDEDRAMSARFAAILDEEPQSELAMMRDLSNRIPRGARIYLGNSLPIREWDLAATRESRGFVLEANRGANGIDGQLSTFLGWCDPAEENWCIVGDLTALYDFNAPWIASQLDGKFRIVIINNGGGRIFSRVPSLRRIDATVREQLIENAHTLRFDQWTAMWGIADNVIELLPDAEASRRVWEKYDRLWA